MIQLTPEEMKRRLRFLRIDGMVDVFVDRETGQELYAGRRGAVDEGNTHPDFPGRRLSELYEWGTALVDRYLLPFKEGYAERRTDAAREELSRGCRLLECVTQQCDDGATFFTLGLAYRVLGQHDREYTALKRASELIPDKTGALREFAQTCLHLGHADEAVAAAWKATELDPADLGLRCNLALALMVKGDIDQASRIAADVLHADPADPVSRNVANLLERIRRGETPRPDRLPLPP